MKPSDFFIGSRQLFGFLVPGTVWAAIAILMLLSTEPNHLLRMAVEANLVEGLSFLAVAFVLGTLMQWPSYEFAKRFGSLVMGRAQRVTRNHPDWVLWSRAYRILRKRYPKSVPHLLLRQERTDKARYSRRRYVFTACKRAVLVKSPILSKRLLEAEDEINLVGMLPLPILFFTLTILNHWNEIASSIPLTPPPILTWPLIIGIGGLVVDIRLIRRFHLLREDEERSCVQIFLLIEGGLVAPAGGEPDVGTPD